MCRHRFAKTEAPSEPKPKAKARKIVAPVAKPKAETAPPPPKAKRKRIDATSHPDCEYCKANRERAKAMMQDLRKRRAKESVTDANS